MGEIRETIAREWNAAIDAAVAVCAAVAEAAKGQGQQMYRPARGQSRNPNAHLSAEITLGAMRCADEIAKLRVNGP